MNGSTHISTWVTADTRQHFAAVAKRHGLSESALLKRLIEQMLLIAGIVDVASVIEEGRGARSSRVTVRLQPDDRILLRERAAARSMPVATYVSVLVRAHLRSLAPVPKDELAALRRSVAELGAIGRNLNQIVLATHQSGRVTAPARDDLRDMLRVCQGLRDHVRALVRANAVSWQVGHGEPHG